MKYDAKTLVVAVGLTLLFRAGSTPAAQPSTLQVTAPAAQSSVTAAYYVNCSDGSGGSGTASSPFGSLAQAQSAMENSSIKTAIVSGNCTISSGWNLSVADSGETWEAACGQVTTINGGGTGYINVNGANNFAMYGFTIENLGTGVLWDKGGLDLSGGSEPITGDVIRWNTFLNCTMDCIVAMGISNSVIDSNTINGVSDGYPAGFNIDSTESTDGLGFVPAAISIWGGANASPTSSSNNLITNNLIENTQGGGVTFWGNNNIIGSNIITNTGTELFDGGAIYSSDPGHVETGNQITNNDITNFGGAEALTDWTSAIYLDCGVSNVLVSGNICSGGCGGAAFAGFGSGNNTTVENNIFDLSSGQQLGLAPYQGTCPVVVTSGNSFKQNIVYSSGSFPNPLWTNGGGGRLPPTDTSNLYYSASGATIPNNSGPYSGIVDSNPIYANPEFADPAANNYSMPSTSPAYTQAGFQPLSTNRGPSLNPVCPNGY